MATRKTQSDTTQTEARRVVDGVANDLDSVARRLRTIARILYDDVGEALAGCDESDDVYPYFELMLDAIRTEATRIEKHTEQLFRKEAA